LDEMSNSTRLNNWTWSVVASGWTARDFPQK